MGWEETVSGKFKLGCPKGKVLDSTDARVNGGRSTLLYA